MHPEMVKALDEKETPFEDLSKMKDDDVQAVKKIFIEKKLSYAHNHCNSLIDTLYEFCIDIISKRVPMDNVNVKVDQIMSKIKFIEIPEGIVPFGYKEKVTVEKDGAQAEEEQEVKQNTNENAVLILKVPKVEEEYEVKIEITKEEMAQAIKDGGQVPEPKTEIKTKLVDTDQENKALSVPCRDVPGLKAGCNQFYLINTYAGKEYREDFIEFINKTYPEFFDENEDLSGIKEDAHAAAQEDIDKFIKDTCGEYEMPCLEFEVNAFDI